MTKKTFSYMLFPSKEIDKKIIYSIVIEGRKVVSRTSLKIKINPQHWDSTRKRVTSKDPDHKEINLQLKKKEEEFLQSLNIKVNSPNVMETCFLEFMKTDLNKSIEDNSLRYSTAKKYMTIQNCLEKVVFEKFKQKKLTFSMLTEIDNIREITLGVQNNLRGSTISKKNTIVVKNYISVFRSYVQKWNRTIGSSSPINTTFFLNFTQKNHLKKLATYLSREEIELLKNFVPIEKRKRCYNSQILAKNIFLFQYYCAGIRIIDALTLTNKNFTDEMVFVNIRKTSDILSTPITVDMMNTIIPYYPNLYEQVIEEIKICDIPFDVTSLSQFFRIDHFDFMSLNYKGFIELLNRIKMEDQEFNFQLNEIKKTIENELIKLFFKKLSSLSEQFIFPTLQYEDFKESFENRRYFNEHEEYLIHRARCRHNSALLRVSKSMELKNILTGHSPRHTISQHLSQSDFSDDEIRQVLGHSDVKTTKIYLRERIGVSPTMKIMKRFNETHSNN